MMGIMRSMRKLLVLAIAAALIAGSCGGDDPETDAGRPDAQAEDDAQPEDDAQAESTNLAPDFSVETFDRDTFTLSEHRGTPVVLNFWESW